MPEWMIKGNKLEAYLSACKRADINDFKCDKALTAIFEHCSPAVGKEYLRQILDNNNWLLKETFTNDDIGRPLIVDYKIAKFSPSTLQYIGVIDNLINEFGSLHGKRIVEIGGG